ncbi:DNA gyrase C-terminal beta-propeller domain-containing protein, partial [Chloroflexota bacterium]
AVKEKYADRRKTHIVKLSPNASKQFVLTTTDLTPEKMIWVSVTKGGLISKTRENKMPRLSGNEAPGWIIRANTRDTLYLVTEMGKAAAIPMHAIPESDTTREGSALTKVSALKEDDKLAALFTLPINKRKDTRVASLGDWYVLTITKQGMVKKSSLSELPGASADIFTLVRINEGDKLINLRLSSGGNEILLGTAHGMAIRFSETAVRPMGLVAAGVMGLKLQDGDEVVGMDLLPQAGEVFLIASDGHAKRVVPKQFPKQGRYGQGVVAWKLPGDARVVGMCVGKGTQRASLHLSRLLPKAIRLDDAPIQGRTARGKIIIDLKSGEQIKGLTVPWDVPRPISKKVKKQSSSGGKK